MAASTERSRCWALAIALAVVLFCSPADAARPVIGIVAFTHHQASIGYGLAAILAEELGASGVADVVPPQALEDVLTEADTPFASALLTSEDLAMLAGSMDYVLVGDVQSFTVADKDTKLDLGHQFRDLSELIGGQSKVAQVVIDLRLLRVADGTEVGSLTVEGRESQYGVRLRTVTMGWASSVDFHSEEFRQTNLGRAAYKATGQAVSWLAGVLPLQGSVLAVTSDAVVVDLGAEAGVAVGDELTVFRVDAVSNNMGAAVWTNEQRVAAVQVVQVREDRCLCLVLDGQGAIAEGDTVRPLVQRLSLPLETDSQS